MENSRTAHRWIFTEDQLRNSPSRKKISAATESDYRRQAAYLIRDVAQQLNLNQLVISTAIVYMNRFYMCHSFKTVSRNDIAIAALFLSAKIEECPKKLEHVIRTRHMLVNPGTPQPDLKSYNSVAEDIEDHELILLQTLGFDLMVDHPHKYIVQCARHVRASIQVSQMAYSIATYSLLVTHFCLKYKPTEVAAMCIRLACKWMDTGVPLTSDEKPCWKTLDTTISGELVECMVSEFLTILERYPKMLQKLKSSAGNTPPKDTPNRLEPCATKGPDQGQTSGRPKTKPCAAETNRPVPKQSPDAIAAISSNTRIVKSKTLTVVQYQQRTKMSQLEKKSKDQFANVSKSQSSIPAVQKKANLRVKHQTKDAASQHRMRTSPAMKPQSIIPAVQKKADIRCEYHTKAAESQHRMKADPVNLQSTIPAIQKKADLRVEQHTKSVPSQHRLKTPPVQNGVHSANHSYREQFQMSSPLEMSSLKVPKEARRPEPNLASTTKKQKSSESNSAKRHREPDEERHQSNHVKGWRNPAAEVTDKVKKAKHEVARPSTSNAVSTKPPSAKKRRIYDFSELSESEVQELRQRSRRSPDQRSLGGYLFDMSTSGQPTAKFQKKTLRPQVPTERKNRGKVNGAISKVTPTNGHVTAHSIQATGPKKLTLQRNGFHNGTSSSRHPAKVKKEQRPSQMPTERRAKVKSTELLGKVMPSNGHAKTPSTQVSGPKIFNGDALSRKYGFDPTKPAPSLPPNDIFDSDN